MKSNFFVFTVISLFFLTSCAPILKKFKRKKRSTPPEVFLQPVEYPSLKNKELYSDYYFYLISWMQELKEAMIENISRKRILRACSEIIENFNNLKDMFEEESYLKKIGYYINEFSKIRDIYQKRKILSDCLRKKLIDKCEELEIQFRKDFSYKKIFK